MAISWVTSLHPQGFFVGRFTSVMAIDSFIPASLPAKVFATRSIPMIPIARNWAMTLLAWVWICFAAAGAHAAVGGDATANILYINSYHRGYNWSDGIEQGLRERLEGSGWKLELSVEYLDSRRFPGLAHGEALATAMAAKYAQ